MVSLIEPATPAVLGGGKSPSLLISFGYKLGRLNWTAIRVNRNKRQIARIRVTPVTSQQVLGVNSDPDFHRRPPNEVDTGLQNDEIADPNRLTKVHAVNRYCYDGKPRVPERGDGGRPVHERKHHAAKHVAEHIGMLRQHHF